MRYLLPPECWRSEAFAEDLLDEHQELVPLPREQFGRVMSMMLGSLPLAVGMIGAVFVVISFPG
jgi:hypothetical protein